MHDKIACAKRNNTKYQRKSIYIALQPRELARQPATMRAWRASYNFNSLCGVAHGIHRDKQENILFILKTVTLEFTGVWG
jgi:hypothetical protein